MLKAKTLADDHGGSLCDNVADWPTSNGVRTAKFGIDPDTCISTSDWDNSSIGCRHT